MERPVATIICEHCHGIVELRGTAFIVYGSCPCGREYEFSPDDKTPDELESLEFTWTE